jgi:hypothetical protein
MKFHPDEVLFSPTTACNLNCSHCVTGKSEGILSSSLAVKFLRQAKGVRIKKIGFTGGEPFLTLDFLYAVTKEGIRSGLKFDRITTNGVWFRTAARLNNALSGLNRSGYDGSICVSVDAFHKQDPKKLALFIRSAVSVWGRPDMVSIVYTAGAREEETKKKLRQLSRHLKAISPRFNSAHPYIKGKGLFIKIDKIELSPVGKASRLKDPWDGKWFKEDFCKGPGNIFFVMPNGDVKPCCGYATDLKELTIGNIKRDSAAQLVAKARKNKLVRTIFSSGLSAIRKRLIRSGIKFPEKTSNHCYFCHYILTRIPHSTLNNCLD